MRIEIDTKEDLHNIRHIMRLLQAISVNAGNSSYDSSSFSDSSGLGSSNQTPPAEGPGLFNMFGDSSSSSDSTTTPSIFSEKKDDNSKDFLDQMQVY